MYTESIDFLMLLCYNLHVMNHKSDAYFVGIPKANPVDKLRRVSLSNYKEAIYYEGNSCWCR